ncbi:hypothetical protein [Streptomyces sp. NPDC059009]|uniref:hypothetical protein n=1 Tax=Streptomyces sp. NPDC059009 TaxID=3346694 RepID=UPI003691BD33
MDFKITIAPSRTQPRRWAWLVVPSVDGDGPSANGQATTEREAERAAEARADEIAREIEQRHIYTYSTDTGVRS